MKAFYLSLALATAGALSSPAFADEPSDFLDKPYKGLQHPKETAPASSTTLDTPPGPVPALSNTADLIAKQTPVKSQGSRGTCSIFSATAMLESMLVIKGHLPNTIDLSEEWLEFLISEGASSDGSTSWRNFSALRRKGSVEEQYLPYIGETWETVDHSDLAKQRCGHITDEWTVKSCLIGHRDHAMLKASDFQLTDVSSPLHDPEFLKARKEAAKFKSKYVKVPAFASFGVGSVAEVKALLRSGIPVTLDIDFYYGAWNHRTAPEHGINRDLVAFEAGNVGYPEPGSADRKNSQEDPAGHSVLVVGYDDNAEITTESLMEDGTTKSFTYKGVYYFKNSWGQAGFGKNFTLDGVNHPGYGAITQKYAHEYGGFTQLPIK